MRHRTSHRITLLVILAASAVLAGLLPATAVQPGQDQAPRRIGFQGETGLLPDVDLRRGQREPTAAQRSIVGDIDGTVRWNDFGTPQSLIRYGSFLATDLPNDPVAAARTWIVDNRRLFRLSAREVKDLELLMSAPIGEGQALLFRQRFGRLPAGIDGLLTLAVSRGRIVSASSSVTGATGGAGEPTLSARAAFLRAARDVGFSVEAGDVIRSRRAQGWRRLQVDGFTGEQLVRLVGVPTPLGGVRTAYETFLLDNQPGPQAYRHFIDARTGNVLLRLDEVDYLEEDPRWKVFTNVPPLDYSSTDTRVIWCWSVPSPECERTLANPASPFPWDVGRHESPTETSEGNNAVSYEKWFTNDSFEVGDNPATPSSSREYIYPWTNQWFEERCNPNTTFDSPQRNDIDAAIANLFAGHNRMHDWSYHLGFTETTFNLQEDNFKRGGKDGDPEHGNAQAGGVVGGPPQFLSRDNANQITPPDGDRPVTNMYLWQPIAAGFYAPCVDGDFDMTVIAHEYTHAISNRMVAGPDQRLVGLQANAMGESWSDLVAVEYLNEYGFVPAAQDNPFAVGPYVTTDDVAGIRNYDMTASPLNYSDVGYDLVGPQVHADGEIWSAANFDIRTAMNARYGAGTATLQRDCADGEIVVTACPGNRRWIQLVFDAWLLMPGPATMLDARDAMLAADMMRFGGANQDLLWNAFARRGLGHGATSTGSDDHQPVPSFESPLATPQEGTLVFQPADGSQPVQGAQLFVGHYEARATPVADTDPATALDDTVALVPGTYDFVARANGYGMQRFTIDVQAGQTHQAQVDMPPNLASSFNGATAAGDGTNLGALIDDTEGTNWASLGSAVAGKQVTVALDPSSSSHTIERVQVSAMLRPQLPNPNPEQPNPDPPQNRFSALRQFRILACLADGAVDCSQASQFQVVFTSAPEAFPAIAPRPRAPDLILRSFDVPTTEATHLRLEVLSNQCTGGPDYQGDLDDDPNNVTDCEDGSTQDLNVRAAELQVFAT